MISEIELYRLRDIAYKYLPAAQNRMLASNHRCDDYWYKLYSESTMQSNMNLSAIEMSAIRLLQAVASLISFFYFLLTWHKARDFDITILTWTDVTNCQLPVFTVLSPYIDNKKFQ